MYGGIFVGLGFTYCMVGLGWYIWYGGWDESDYFCGCGLRLRLIGVWLEKCTFGVGKFVLRDTSVSIHSMEVICPVLRFSIPVMQRYDFTVCFLFWQSQTVINQISPPSSSEPKLNLMHNPFTIYNPPGGLVTLVK